MFVFPYHRRKGVSIRDILPSPPRLAKLRTILIADDNERVRGVIRQALERDTGFKICGEAADGTDAVSKAKELGPDLVILDARLPGLTAW
jgi:CheY-like chemotaxis protein